MNTVVRVFVLHAVIVACSSGLFAYDWNNLSEKDIVEIREARHAFYKIHSAGKQEAIVENLERGEKVDGNQNDFDMRYYGLHLDLHFNDSTITASVDYKIKSLIAGLNRVDLNFHNNLTTDSVKVGGATTTFTHAANLLAVNLPSPVGINQEIEMTVYYHGVPYYDGSAGLTFTTQFSTQLCWTKSTPFRARYWWPSKDYPEDKVDSLDLFIECPDNFDIATNGVKVDSTDLDGRKIEHFKHNYPICTYLVAFCVTNYDQNIQTWGHDADSIPYYVYSMPGNFEARDAFLLHGPQSLTMLTERFGQYPFIDEKMGCADFGWNGAMEHQTFAMFATDFHTDWVIAHEQAHQWWGDMITCRTFHHIWINEGFATYSEPLYMEATAGPVAYRNYVQTLKFLGPGSIYVENLTQTEIYDSNLSYDKAAFVLHMLRGVYGDSLFFQGVQAFANSEFRYGTATTEDFVSVFSATVGEDISWFTNEWIYGEGHPDYEYSWQCRPDGLGDYIVDLFIEQVQETPTAFRMPIKSVITTSAGTVDTTIWNQGRFMAYSLPFADSVTNIQLDPLQWILRTTDLVPFGVHVISTILPDAVLGEMYSTTLQAVGGVEPYHWQFLGGDLPFGIDFDTTSAALSGVPTFPAQYFFTLVCKDSSIPEKTDTVSLTVVVVEPSGICGDADGNDIVTISDAVFLINYIFAAGPAPDPLELGDADCNGMITISDAVYLVNYIFTGGPAPCAACP
ncbi:MAG: M1 family aminopeptidase [Candidatus Zixiibacteriota bacterium]